jgi:sulfur transfer protein SufE
MGRSLPLLLVLSAVASGPLSLIAADSHPPSEEQLRQWALQLGDEDYQKREEAQTKLAEAGAAAVPHLKEALKNEDIEVRQRAERLLTPLNREEKLAEAAQKLGDPDWETVNGVIGLLLDRCDEKSAHAVAQAATGTGRNASIAKVLQQEMQKIRMADDEIAKFVEVGKRNPAVQKAVDKKKDEVQRVYRQRAYEACLKEFERLKPDRQEPVARP